MAIIDIIRADVANPNFTFVGDNTVIQQSVVNGAGDLVLYTSDGNSLFSPVDNLRILEIGVQFPHGYVIGDTSFGMRIDVTCIDSGGSFTLGLGEIGTGGETFIQLPNVPQEFEAIEVPTHDYHNLRFPVVGHLDTIRLEASILEGQISQLNAPDIMNGVVVPLLPYMVVKHNFPMVSVVTPA